MCVHRHKIMSLRLWCDYMRHMVARPRQKYTAVYQYKEPSGKVYIALEYVTRFIIMRNVPLNFLFWDMDIDLKENLMGFLMMPNNLIPRTILLHLKCLSFYYYYLNYLLLNNAWFQWHSQRRQGGLEHPPPKKNKYIKKNLLLLDQWYPKALHTWPK